MIIITLLSGLIQLITSSAVFITENTCEIEIPIPYQHFDKQYNKKRIIQHYLQPLCANIKTIYLLIDIFSRNYKYLNSNFQISDNTKQNHIHKAHSKNQPIY